MQDLNEPSDNDYDESEIGISELSVLAFSVDRITNQDEEEVKVRWLEEACLTSSDEDNTSISQIRIPFTTIKDKAVVR